jgi:hypothetical protein
MAMPAPEDLHYTREDFARHLRNLHYPELAERAARELPVEFDGRVAMAWCDKVGLSKDEVMSRVGGSP